MKVSVEADEVVLVLSESEARLIGHAGHVAGTKMGDLLYPRYAEALGELGAVLLPAGLEAERQGRKARAAKNAPDRRFEPLYPVVTGD